MIIQDAQFSYSAKVDKSNRLDTRGITKTETANATVEADSYNINTGLITLTTAGESGVMYLKNNEDRDINVDAIVVIFGPSTGGAATDTNQVRIYRNPTTGTLISGAVDADINDNRNFGSSKTLAALAYKGATGNTITDGSVVIESLVGPGSRVSFAIDLVLTKGDSVGISYEPSDSNTSMKCMAAIVLHLEPDL